MKAAHGHGTFVYMLDVIRLNSLRIQVNKPGEEGNVAAISESCPLAVLKALCYACLYFGAYRITVNS